MPPFVPLADGAQVEVVFTLDGLVVENRLWFLSRQPPITTAQLSALATGVFTWHTGQVIPLLASELVMVAVRATDWTAPAGTTQQVTAVGINGGNSSGSHSANVSYRVRFKGTSDTPGLYNANFIPGIPKDAVNGNFIDVDFKDSIFDAYVNLIDLAPGFGPFPAWRWVITSQIKDKAYRSEQLWSRTDFIQFPNIYISPRRRRISRLRKMLSSP